jgi:hypothetical protein
VRDTSTRYNTPPYAHQKIPAYNHTNEHEKKVEPKRYVEHITPCALRRGYMHGHSEDDLIPNTRFSRHLTISKKTPKNNLTKKHEPSRWRVACSAIVVVSSRHMPWDGLSQVVEALWPTTDFRGGYEHERHNDVPRFGALVWR